MSFVREQIVKGIIDVVRKKRSPKWRKVRKAYLKEHPCCEACGRKDGIEIHHVKDFSTNPELELDPDNLIALCSKTCHCLLGHLQHWASINPNIKIHAKLLLDEIKNRRKREKKQ
jgi:hypothetical protein